MAYNKCLIECDANGHSEKFKQSLHAMRNDPETSDVTLICEDLKVVKGHKMVIKSFSPVLREILKNIPVTSAVVYLKGINSNVMDPLLDFMYCGKVSIDKDLVPNFFKLGKHLEVELLSEHWDTSENNLCEKESNKDIMKKEYFEQEKESSTLKFNNLNTRNFTCPECDKDLMYEESLRRHFLKYHETSSSTLQISGQGKFSCSECDKEFSFSSHLRRHMKSVHEGKRFQCDNCDYTATQRGHLKNHMKSVHEGRRFQCDYCDYKATQTGQLKNHIQSKHVKPKM